MQTKIDELEKEVERLTLEVEGEREAGQRYKRDYEMRGNTITQNKKSYESRIDSLNIAVSDYKKQAEEAKKQATDYKREIDNLADTKTVLDNLMAILRSPNNDYQKVVNELNDMLRQERGRANALEQELRNIQFDIQRNQFLEGKVQAYEAMFRVNPIKAVQCDSEQQETA